MKNTEDEKKLVIAEESLINTAKALVKTYHHTDNHEKKRELFITGNILHNAIHALNKNEFDEELRKSAALLDPGKDDSSLFTKINAFFQSIFKFLKTPFTKQSKTNLDNATEEIINEITNPDIGVAKSVNQSIEQKENKALAKSEQVQNSNISAPPPPPPPPSPPSFSTEFTIKPQGLMEAIKLAERSNLRKADDRSLKKVDSPTSTKGNMINELEKHLQARNKAFGQKNSVGTTSSKYAEDQKLFEQARKEEEARQARIERSENERLAAIAAKEKSAVVTNTKIQPNPLSNLKPGEIPPPPPPPPMPPSFIKNSDNIKENIKTAKSQSNHKSSSQIKQGFSPDLMSELQSKLNKKRGIDNEFSESMPKALKKEVDEIKQINQSKMENPPTADNSKNISHNKGDRSR